jgi:hypothetical protein
MSDISGFCQIIRVMSNTDNIEKLDSNTSV